MAGTLLSGASSYSNYKYGNKAANRMIYLIKIWDRQHDKRKNI